VPKSGNPNGKGPGEGETSMRPALSPILYLQGMTGYNQVLKAGVIQLCRPRRATLGNNDVQGSISSERLVPFALGLPGAVGTHRWDLPWAVGEAFEPLIETMKPIQATNGNGDPHLGSLTNCLAMGTHL
jgi:hypothetical protein